MTFAHSRFPGMKNRPGNAFPNPDGFAFLVPAHPGSPGQRAVKRMYVIVLRYCTASLLSKR